MSYWPFVTLFIFNLVLILFFRRVDKRKINFNKFKKFAEKLSRDFDLFLKGKRDELQGQIGQLAGVVARAEDVLNRIERSEETLEKTQGELEGERLALESVKREMEKLRGLKDELGEEASRIGKSLPSMKSLSKRVEKISLDIAENEKALRSVSAIIPTIEKRVQEKSDRALEDASSMLVEEARGRFGSLIEEYRQNMQTLSETGRRELETFKKQTGEIIERTQLSVAGILDEVKICHDRVEGLEERRLNVVERRLGELDELFEETKGRVARVGDEAVDTFLERAEQDYKRYVDLLEENRNALKTEIYERVESQAKDLSSYIARLEGRVQNLLQNIKDETDKYGEVLHLKAKAHQSEADMLKGKILSEITEEANRNLLLIKPIVSEVNEKLTSYKKEFTTLYSAVKSKLSSQQDEMRKQIEGFSRDIETQKQSAVESLQASLGEVRVQLSSIGEQLESTVGEAAASVRENFVQRLKEYEERIHTLEGGIGDLKHIADTGQEMIEQRIDTVFKNYRPEIERKIDSLKRETETIFTREHGRILERIGSIIGEADTRLDEGERKISGFVIAVDARLKESEEKLSGQEERILENVNRVRIEARQELVRELENLKNLFKEERDRSVERFRVELSDLNEHVQEVNSSVDDIRGVIERKIAEAMENVDSSVKEVETSYLKTGDELKERLQRDLVHMKGEVEQIHEQVDGMKASLIKDVTGAIDYFKRDVEKELEGHREEIYARGRELQELVVSIAEGAKAELKKSHQEAEDALQGFEIGAREVEGRMEKRVQDIEGRISTFEKESTVLKRAVRFKEKVEEDIQQFSDIMLQLKEDKKDILSMRKVIDGLKRDEGDISAKVRQLKSEKKLVQDIAKNAEQAIGLITVVDEKIKLIEEERDLLEKIESGMKDLDKRFDSLKKKAEELATREKDIEVSIETITKTKEFIAKLEQRADLLNTNLVELREREDDLKNKVTIIDEKTGSLLNYESRIEDVLSKFTEMDSLVADIEERSKQLQSTREWLARTESRLTNLTKEAERLVREMSSIGTIPGDAAKKTRGNSVDDRSTLLSKESESKVKTVLTLFEQKWTIPEICKVTKMSRGEVELILELNNR
jgi:DNA repair exonuclease SbcCD ATPase subunit